MTTAYPLRNDLPPVYMKEEDTRKFVQILDDALARDRADVLKIIDNIQYDEADDEFLDLMLIEEGWDLPIALTTAQKRKAVKLFREFYQQRGLDATIIDFVDRFMGITITIERATTDVAILELQWRIPFHRLMGSEALLQMIVHAPAAITATQESDLTAIVDAFRSGIDFWTLVKDL